VSNYNADIRIGVVGQSKLKTLQTALDKANASVNKLNKALVLKARTQTIKLNTKGAAAQLRLLENQLNKLGRVITVKVRTTEEKGKSSSGSTVIAAGSNQGTGVALASLSRQATLQKEITSASKAESAAAEVTERIRNQIEQTDRAILKTREEQTRLNKTLPEQRGNRKLSFKDQIQQLSDAGQLTKKLDGDFAKLKTRLADAGPGDAGKEYKRFFDGIADGTKRLTAAQGQAEEAARTGIQKQIEERRRLEKRKDQLLKRGQTAEIAGANRVTEAIKTELQERESAEIAYEQRRQRRISRIQKRDELLAKKNKGQGFAKGARGAAGVVGSSALSGIPGLGGAAAGGTVGFFTAGVPGAIGGALAGAAVDGVAALAALGKQAAVTRAEFDKLQISLELAAGADFENSVKTIQRVVDDFNAPLVDTTEQFTKLYAASQGSGIAFNELEDLFVGLSAANKAYAGDAEDLNGILRAFTQIISKGTVQSEELKGQVGERLPGAFKKAADSLGLTTAQLQKALENGDVNSAEFVKKFGKYMLQYEEDAKIIAKSPAEAGARLKTAMDKLLVSLGPVFASMGAAFQDFATFAINSLIPLANFLNNMFAKISEAPIAIAKAQRNEALQEFRRADADDWDFDLREENLARAVANVNSKLAERDALEAALQRRSKRQTQADLPNTNDPKPTKAGGGSKSGPSDTTAQTRVEIQMQQELLRIERERFDLVGKEASLEDFDLQRQQLKAGLAANLQKIDQDNITAASKIAEKELERLKYSTDLQAIKNAEKEFTLEQTKAFEEQVLELQNAIALESAITDEMKRQTELKIALADIDRSGLSDERKDTLRALTESVFQKRTDNADPLNQYFNQLTEKVNDTRGQITQLAQTVESELGSAISNSITGLIDGTTTVEEAFSQMFANIGKAFIDMAAQMLAQKAVLALLSAFGPSPAPAGFGGVTGGRGPEFFGPAFATGGVMAPNSMALVGEHGPELVTTGSSPKYVTNASQTNALAKYSPGGGGGGNSGPVTVNYNGPQLTFDGNQYISKDALPEIINTAAKQGAKLGEANTFKAMRNRRSTRQSIGI
jgi:tape measure domain-containing protein